MLNETPSSRDDAILRLQRDVEALKRPRAVQIGNWHIHQSQYGDLVADNVSTGLRYILAAHDTSKRTGPVGIDDPTWRDNVL